MAYKDIERRKATRKAYYAKNREKLIVAKRKHREEHPGSTAKACKKWREKWPDRAKAATEKYWRKKLGIV